MSSRLVLVGNPEEYHTGAHLKRAAESMGIDVSFCDVREAYSGPSIKQKVNWWLRGRRPVYLQQFSAKVFETCRDVRPEWLLTTGIAPLEEPALQEIGRLQVHRVNYLTDDPWNTAHRAPWFLHALPQYDCVFSTRRAILGDLRQQGCVSARHLPFAYAPELHFPERPTDESERNRLTSDILFAGGADRDRMPYAEALIHAGFNVALYGGYWNRYTQTAGVTRGHADLPTIRKAVSAAKVSLCLVRRANRDGSVMRSFELPAMNACMLTEDTEEHREIFGDDGETMTYFRTREEMVEKLRYLLAHDAERSRLKEAAHHLITNRPHTYRDRLETILECVPA